MYVSTAVIDNDSVRLFQCPNLIRNISIIDNHPVMVDECLKGFVMLPASLAHKMIQSAMVHDKSRG